MHAYATYKSLKGMGWQNWASSYPCQIWTLPKPCPAPLHPARTGHCRPGNGFPHRNRRNGWGSPLFLFSIIARSEGRCTSNPTPGAHYYVARPTPGRPASGRQWEEPGGQLGQVEKNRKTAPLPTWTAPRGLSGRRHKILGKIKK